MVKEVRAEMARAAEGAIWDLSTNLGELKRALRRFQSEFLEDDLRFSRNQRAALRNGRRPSKLTLAERRAYERLVALEAAYEAVAQKLSEPVLEIETRLAGLEEQKSTVIVARKKKIARGTGKTGLRFDGTPRKVRR